MRSNGYFVLTDYFAESNSLEREYFENFEMLKQKQGITDNAFYHYDTPLTVEHEIVILNDAGFSDVKVLRSCFSFPLLFHLSYITISTSANSIVAFLCAIIITVLFSLSCAIAS